MYKYIYIYLCMCVFVCVFFLMFHSNIIFVLCREIVSMVVPVVPVIAVYTCFDGISVSAINSQSIDYDSYYCLTSSL